MLLVCDYLNEGLNGFSKTEHKFFQILSLLCKPTKNNTEILKPYFHLTACFYV